MREVWRTEWVGNTKTLDMHVSSLRRKLGPAGARVLTVRGVGLRYQHVADADADADGYDDDMDPEVGLADVERSAAPAREQA
jgi:DNA-binding winged helix-turn-helix (wHTH) protein